MGWGKGRKCLQDRPKPVWTGFGAVERRWRLDSCCPIRYRFHEVLWVAQLLLRNRQQLLYSTQVLPANYPYGTALSELFGGQLRYRVLSALFTQPERAFHLRGLAAAAGVDAGNTHRIVRRLLAAQLCEAIPDKPYTRYRARKDSPLYADLVRLFSRGSELMADVREVAAALPGMVAIYGSVARGEERADSDVDVLVIGSISTISAQAAFKPVGRKHGRKINVTAATEEEVLDMLEAGSAFWRDVLTGQLMMLKGEVPDEIARRLSEGGEQGISNEGAGSPRDRKLPQRIQR